ncbi:hypothetical protein [Pseudoalteromonas piratica]|uniref:Uncharacterized protein n=1 Tax=Pseudoalteromonas piratica TaxID=1348114 RepID=A0A0A7ELH3_9GAMM|nr:hypothetical protein [Pseudoalteromonas piratica]AIY67484.1 hypothetical protein OM33_20910 [Pseudoalteromonas piratica]
MTFELTTFRQISQNKGLQDTANLIDNHGGKFGDISKLGASATPLRNEFVKSLDQSGMMKGLSLAHQTSLKNSLTPLTIGEVRDAFKSSTIDIRGNDKVAAAKESTIARQGLEGMGSTAFEAVKEHISGQLDRIIDMENKLISYREHKAAGTLSTSELTPEEQKVLKKIDKLYTDTPIEKALAHRKARLLEKIDTNKIKIAEIFGDSYDDMKTRLDAFTNFYLISTDAHSKERYYSARANDVFKDRGRGDDIEWRDRAPSTKDKNSGISAQEHRRESQENVFAKSIFHAKGILTADVDTSNTVKAFRENGAPFIGGVSGSLLSEILDIEFAADGKEPKVADSDGISADELAKRELLLGVKSMELIALGHHSLSECLLAAQTLGYFQHIESPLKNYPKAVSQFEQFMSDALKDKPEAAPDVAMVAAEQAAPLGGIADDAAAPMIDEVVVAANNGNEPAVAVAPAEPKK